ncbi:lipocalin-like domain-containing protein [Flavobacterium sp. W21_SRS_FM6]|uniref:lipocalin-like domain-containing protein n=1 Tax=Flavobacterium sp. W21_SRS_FM6 TaxID=3240268 RepID=UPI003F93F295
MVKLTRNRLIVVLVSFGIALSTVLIKQGGYTQAKTPKAVAERSKRLGLPANSAPETLGQQVVANYPVRFPDDHNEHPLFDIEWWYLTANVKDEQGRLYGLQWTLFRFRNPTHSAGHSAWANNQIYMGHASVNSLDSHWFAEKFARGEVGNAGVNLAPFALTIDDWAWTNSSQIVSEQQALLPANLTFTLPLITQNEKGNPVMTVSATLQQDGPFVLQGDKGYSIKSADGAYASYYYSNPFIDITGKFTFKNAHSTDNKHHISFSGQAWFDHEWTSQLVDSKTLGWDWLSLHLDDGSKLMAFRMRIEDQPAYITGTLVHADGNQTLLTEENLSLTPRAMIAVNQLELPLHWQVNIPQFGVDIAVKTAKNDQWNPALMAYYEGMVSVTGTHTGTGFLELTGY